MQGDPKVIDYLNKGLRSELTAISQYWLHYRLLNNWGLLTWPRSGARNPSRRWNTPTSSPTGSCSSTAFPTCRCSIPCGSARTSWKSSNAIWPPRYRARALYQEAATHCHGVKDYVSRDLFEQLMKDEEHHIDFLETQLDLIKRIGLELYTQKHVGGLESEH